MVEEDRLKPKLRTGQERNLVYLFVSYGTVARLVEERMAHAKPARRFCHRGHREHREEYCIYTEKHDPDSRVGTIAHSRKQGRRFGRVSMITQNAEQANSKEE